MDIAIQEQVIPLSYKSCMAFIRSHQVQSRILQICEDDGDPILAEDYKFVLYYTIARLVFSNGARPEVAYKAHLNKIKNYTVEGQSYQIVILPDAKAGMTMNVMSLDDTRFFDAYQSLRKRLANQLSIPDDTGYVFVQSDMTRVGHQVSENIMPLMVRVRYMSEL